MVKGTITINNESGLHLRPASELAKAAGKLRSEITIVAGEMRVDAKSVLLLMSAGITKGTTVDIICEGESEEDDLKVMMDTIAGGLGE